MQCPYIYSADFGSTWPGNYWSIGPGITAIVLQEKRSSKAIARFILSGSYKPFLYLLLFIALLGATFWFPTQELNPYGSPLFAFPIILLVQTISTGDREEIGWQGFLRHLWENLYPFRLPSYCSV